MAEATLVSIGARSSGEEFASDRSFVAKRQIVAVRTIVTGSAHAIGEKSRKKFASIFCL